MDSFILRALESLSQSRINASSISRRSAERTTKNAFVANDAPIRPCRSLSYAAGFHVSWRVIAM